MAGGPIGAVGLPGAVPAVPPGRLDGGELVVNDGRSVLTLGHDRTGSNAAIVRFTAAAIRQERTKHVIQPGIRRYVRIETRAPLFSATWFDIFDGGCVTTRLTVPAAQRAELASEVTVLLGFKTRRALQQALDQRSDGRLHLDPSD